MRITCRLTILISALLASISAFAQQEQADSLVVLLSSKSAQMVDVEGASYRKVVGPARFMHNDTYLLCDTALWNVETKIIEAWGNVSILQEETVLTSEKLTYLIDEDLAQFRGTLVQLEDKDHNTLRTRHLDYNTKDSLAIFKHGGAMRDKDGQIIESENGTYDSKAKRFTFRNHVNMFTDSIFVKTNLLEYESNRNLATFGYGTNAWQEDNMLSSDSGWYNREKEIFFFNNNVHVMTDSQEGWCDSLYFHRNTSDVEMLGRAQVTDTTRNVFALAGRIHYLDSISKITLTREPAVITETEDQQGVKDTVYLGADHLVYYTLQMWQVDSMAVVDAEKRLEVLDQDPVNAFRRKAAEEAAKAAAEAAKNDPNYRPPQKKSAPKSAPAKPAPQNPEPKTPESPSPVARDSVAVADTLMPSVPMALPDSLDKGPRMSLPDSLAVTDSLASADTVAVEPPKDTTRVGFLEALKNVRIFRKDMQVVCDSLLYSDLDSLARMYIDPVIWQEKVRQYSSDSLFVAVTQGGIEKASLMSNAFIAIQEDTVHYDQIKSTEMMAYFDDKGGLRRFDALGGASAMFYIEENDALATVNKADSKMLSATFKDGELQRVYYFEDAKNDGYPVVQLSPDEMYLKGFNWQQERRPADRNAVTPLSLRPSQRKFYAARPRAKFLQTDKYFPGYMNDIYRQIQVRDSLRAVREREAEMAKRAAEAQSRRDSLFRVDSLARVDSLFGEGTLSKIDSLDKVDSLNKVIVSDSLAVADSLQSVPDSVAIEKILTPEEIKAAAKAEKQKAKEAARKARQEVKEARWAELDKRDAEKQKAKEEKALEKLRKKKRKAFEAATKQAEKDAAVLDRYRKRFEARQRKELEKAARKSSSKSSSDTSSDSSFDSVFKTPAEMGFPDLEAKVKVRK